MMKGQNVHQEQPYGQMGADGRIYGAAGGTSKQYPDGTWRSDPVGSNNKTSAVPDVNVEKYKKGNNKYLLPVSVDAGDGKRAASVTVSIEGAHRSDADQIIAQLTKALNQKGFKV